MTSETSTETETYEPLRDSRNEWGRRHPWRMCAWWLAEAAVRLTLGMQDAIEATNRAKMHDESTATS